MNALQLTISIGAHHDLAASRKLADERGLGLEIQHFTDANLLDGAWRAKLDEVKAALKGFGGVLSMHGPYEGLDPAAFDPQLRKLSKERYLHALRIADELGARTVILHAWYLPTLKWHGGVPVWVKRHADAWGELARAAEKQGATIALENTWEPDGEAQLALIEAVNSPGLRACLDTGHATMIASITLREWIRQLEPRLVYVHAHSNSGNGDEHWPFTRGVLDARATLANLAALARPPRVCLEMRALADQVDSLRLIDTFEKTV